MNLVEEPPPTLISKKINIEQLFIFKEPQNLGTFY
jgi:hypothetical protein